MQQSLKKATISNTAWKFAERIIAQGVSLIVSIVLARILAPEDYGVVSIVTIFFTFANVIISGGLNSALIQKKDADIEDYSSILIVSVLVAFLIYIVLFIASPFIANVYKKTELIPVFRVMGLVLPVTAVKSVVCAKISSSLQFKHFFFATIGGTIVSAIVGIYMAYHGFGAWALVAQQMTNTTIDTVLLLLSTRMKFVLRINVQKFRGLFKYGWKVFLSSLIDTTYNQASPLFIGAKYTAADLSFYNRGQTFPSTISATVNSTLSAVLFPVLSKVQDDKERILNYTRLFIRLSSYLVFPMMLGFMAVSDSFISVVLTDKWLPASPYIKIFCISNMFIMIATGNCESIKAIGRSDVFLKMEVIKKTCYFIIIGLFVFFTDSPIMLACSYIVCTIVAIAVNTFPNRKLLGYSYFLQLKDLLPNFGVAVAMAVLVYLMNGLMINKGLLLILQVVIGIVVYIVFSVFTKNDAFMYLFRLACSYINKKA